MPAPVYLDSYGVEMRPVGSDTWTDITAYITSSIKGFYGNNQIAPGSRIDAVGTLSFTVCNKAVPGYFVPGNSACLAGFATGMAMQFYTTYNSIKIIKWFGHVYFDGIQPQNVLQGPVFVDVTAKNWIFFASYYRLITQTVRANKTLADMVGYITTETTEQPLAISYGTMQYTFPSIMDTLQINTTALSEIAKGALSEMGYVYMTRAGLQVDGRYDMANRAYPTIAGVLTVQESYSDIWDQNGGLILDQNGNNIVGATAISLYADQHYDADEKIGKSIANLSKVTITPRQSDAANVQLYKLPSAVLLPGNSSTTITGKFMDPNQKAQTVAATTVSTPAKTTDWLVNIAANGSGGDVTALVSLAFSYVANQFTAVFTNSGSSAYLTQLNVNGKGVYLYTQVIVGSQNNAGIANNGLQELDLNLPYQTDYNTAFLLSLAIVNTMSIPKYEVFAADYHANNNANLMNAFIYYEPGQRFLFTETKTGINQDHHVTGVAFEVQIGGIIDFTLYLRNSDYIAVGV